MRLPAGVSLDSAELQTSAAVILSQNNMEEESILEDASFRKTLSDLGFAEIWVTPNMGSNHFRFDLGEDKILDKMLKDLADARVIRKSPLPRWCRLVIPPTPAGLGYGRLESGPDPGRSFDQRAVPYFTDALKNKDGTPNISGSPDWGARPSMACRVSPPRANTKSREYRRLVFSSQGRFV